MIPLRISLKGFLSYREEQELLFDGASLWVLAGPNGAGKSAVFDAITYGVFGTCRGMAQNLTELINHHCDALQVEIDFVVNGLVYRVRRTLDRRGSATRGAWCLLPAEDGGAPYVEPITNTDMERGFEDWVKQTIGTFETFTSSVLLQQGDSEKLLRASPKERYAILAEIIDLAPYQRLSERVEGKRTEAKRETNDLQQQLTNAPVVSDDDLIQAATVTLSATSEHQMAQQDVERLVQVFTQAGEWERLQKDLATNHRELAIAKQLLERADEIETGYARLQELEGVLPILKRITAGRLRLSQKSEDIISLHAEITGLSAELFSLEQVKELAEAEESKLLAAQNQAHKDSSLLSDQLAKLAPLLAHGDRYEHVTQERDKAQRHLLTFPEDLPTDVERAEEELNYLTDVQTALSWLQPLYERRDALVRVNAQEQVAADGLTALYDEVHQKESRQEALDKEIVLLQRTERALHNAAAAAQDRYDQVIERLDTFSQIAEQPVCDLCGQQITEEHVRQERERLVGRVTAAKAALEQAQEHHASAVSKLEESQKQSGKLKAEIEEQKRVIIKEQRLQHSAQTESQSCLTDLRRAFDKLPTQYQIQVAITCPHDASGWLETYYPSAVDLLELGKSVLRKEECSALLNTLRKQQMEWQRALDKSNDALAELKRLEAIHSYDEILVAREAEGSLKGQQVTLHATLIKCEQDYEQAQETANQHRRAYKELSQKLQSRNGLLISAEATKEEIEKSLQDAQQSLPTQWQEHTDFTSAQLSLWETEHSDLAKYKDEISALSQARHSIDGISKAIEGLEARIGELPQEARRPSADVEGELTTAKKRRDAAHVALQYAQSQETKLNQQHAYRLKLASQYKTAARELHLYSKLSQYMGREGIQLYLLRAAEQSIVALANEVLGGLSRGKMHLEPREPKGKSKAGLQRGQALDLVVHDQKTGKGPMPVALASGSQRFRIAVSLALAIGRYVGQGSRHLGSVIVDEGFGSLDKLGRDDMIQQLNDLQQEVSRVILVSHEEEFAGAFANGYAIELVDGASNVQLLER